MVCFVELQKCIFVFSNDFQVEVVVPLGDADHTRAEGEPSNALGVYSLKGIQFPKHLISLFTL